MSNRKELLSSGIRKAAAKVNILGWGQVGTVKVNALILGKLI